MPTHFYGEGYYAGDKRLVAEFEKRAARFARKNVKEVENAARAAGVPFSALVTKSPVPYRGIVAAAEKKGCDAIFIGSHGYGGLKKLLLGSVTQEVLAHSKIPVLVFR